MDYDYDRPEVSNNRQRRIIYYTTLPEVVRTPPNVNLRYRYNYRNNLDPSSYYDGRPRLEDRDRFKSQSPLKVSTDLNVRGSPKNPESRIYGESDRRYAYKAPSYRADWKLLKNSAFSGGVAVITSNSESGFAFAVQTSI